MRWPNVGYAVTILVQNCVFLVPKLMKSFDTEVPMCILDAQVLEIFGTEISRDFGIDMHTANTIFIPTNTQ
jgi:hypothetical protein